MTNHVLLDNINHKDLKIITGYDQDNAQDNSQDYGDNISYTVAFPEEFRRLQGDYPIFMRKNSHTAQFEAIALLGFADNENLFLDHALDGKGKAWNASYVPLTIQRRPFLIGFQNTNDDGISNRQPVVHIDMDSPRISQTEGEPVFLEHGGNSPYLDHINSVLLEIYQGGEQTLAFAELLIEFDLLEAFSLKIQLADGSITELVGFYTINEDKLAKLSGEVLDRLHQLGYLQAIYMMMASVANVPAMIDKKNARL